MRSLTAVLSIIVLTLIPFSHQMAGGYANSPSPAGVNHDFTAEYNHTVWDFHSELKTQDPDCTVLGALGSAARDHVSYSAESTSWVEKLSISYPIDPELARVINLNLAGNPDGLLMYTVEKGSEWAGEYKGDDAPANWNCMRYFLVVHHDVYAVELTPAEVIDQYDSAGNYFGQKVTQGESLLVEVVKPRFEVVGKPVVITWGND